MADVYTDYSLGIVDHDLHVPILEEYCNSVVIPRIGQNCVDLTQVSASCPAGEAVSALEQYIEFVVFQCTGTIMMQEACSHQARADAFALMMQSSCLSNTLPQRWRIVTLNKKLELKNDLINFFERNKLGWTASYAKQCGESFVNTLEDVLWYTNGNHQKRADRGHGVQHNLQPSTSTCTTSQKRRGRRRRRRRRRRLIIPS